MNKNSIEGTKSLIVLLLLAMIAFYSAYNYQKHVQELKLMEERVVQIQTQQEFLIRLMKAEHSEKDVEQIRKELNQEKLEATN